MPDQTTAPAPRSQHRANTCLYPQRDPNTACGYAHTVRDDDTTEEAGRG